MLRKVRVMDVEQAGLKIPAGLVFSNRANSFQMLDERGSGQAATSFIKLTPFAHSAGSARIAAGVQNPINMALDNKAHRLLIYQGPARQLLEVAEDLDGNLDPASLTRYDASRFGVQDAQGMSVDPLSGILFILDTVGPKLVRVMPGPYGSFSNVVVSTVDLQPAGLRDVRGLAYDPASEHVHVVSPAEQKLYELTQSGQMVATRDLLPFHLGDPQALLFAPTTDQTDAASNTSLFMADGSSGQIVEYSLMAAIISATASFTSSLVTTTDMSAASFSPPSPDPSGLTYLPNSNTLLMSDGEVEETVNGITHFHGANVWEMTLGGSVVRTANISKVAPTVVPMTNEPTGVAWNPNNGHYYVSDDSDVRIYDLNPGADGLIGTADDTSTYFSTTANGNNNGDPEGIAYDSWNNHVFVSDGVNAEIYEYTAAGTLVNHFDVATYGVVDNESVEFNPSSGTLFILSNAGNRIIVETTTSGTLLQTIDVSATNAIAPAGLTYAPASNGSGSKHFYIVDRGIDNNDNPNIIDGKMYEITAPVSGTPGNLPPLVNAGPDQTIALPSNAVLDATVTDDGLPNPPGTITATWSKISGPGMVAFGNASAVDTTASFSAVGSYILRLTVSDGELSSSDDVTISVTGNGGSLVTEVRVATSSDDAEESASGSVSLASTDLELVYDGSNQTVGMRFNGLGIPQGAHILNAYVQFKVDEVNTEATSLTIRGQAADNAATFVASGTNISSRPRTTASAGWSPVAWTTVNEIGTNEQTPDLSTVLQEIVSRPGWAGGNSLVVMITGTGHRTARAYDGEAAGAPLLHVEYETQTSTQTPSATFTATPTATSTPTALFTPTATDTPLPTATATNTSIPPTATPTGTPTNTPLPTSTPTATFTATPTSTSTATFTATATNTPLPDLIFADSFESGNLSAWSSSATDSGSLGVSGTAALVGTRGMQALINDNNSIFVTDDRPTTESRYRVRFYFDPNSITMAKNNSHFIFYGFNATATAIMRVEFRLYNGKYQIRAGLLNDSTSYTSTSWFSISDAPHAIELDWRASTAAGANNGGLTLWIDGVEQANVTGIDNDTRRMESIRLGAVSGINNGTRGTEYFDAFESHRQTYIGP